MILYNYFYLNARRLVFFKTKNAVCSIFFLFRFASFWLLALVEIQPRIAVAGLRQRFASFLFQN